MPNFLRETEDKCPLLKEGMVIKMDIKLYYEELGCGIPFVLVHGNNDTLNYFVKQSSHFSKKYRVITPETRGHGRTPRGERPFTIKQFSDDLYNFVCSLEISSFILLGFSDGANVAMYFASEHSDMLKALILNSGNMTPSGLKRRFLCSIKRAYRHNISSKVDTAEMRLKNEMLSLMVDQPGLTIADLVKIKCPTLVIAGTHDLITMKETYKISKSIPSSELVFLDGTHGIASLKPEIFNAAVDKFLDNLSLK